MIIHRVPSMNSTPRDTMRIMQEIVNLEADRLQIVEKINARYQELGLRSPYAENRTANVVGTGWATASATSVAGGAFTRPKPNRDRIKEILATGQVMTSAEIFEKMGQSTLNTTQSEVSRMVNETKELVRHGDGVRLRKPEDP